ncbi:hypothetical protein ACF1AE_34465, partial [Streptomyces sp. NPDC014986]
YRSQYARADAEDERRRAAEREAQRPVCKRCGRKFTDQCWEETTAHRTAWRAGDVSVCGDCHADEVAREEAAAEATRTADVTESWVSSRLVARAGSREPAPEPARAPPPRREAASSPAGTSA